MRTVRRFTAAEQIEGGGGMCWGLGAIAVAIAGLILAVVLSGCEGAFDGGDKDTKEDNNVVTITGDHNNVTVNEGENQANEEEKKIMARIQGLRK